MRNKSALAAIASTLLLLACTTPLTAPSEDYKNQDGQLIAGFRPDVQRMIRLEESQQPGVTCIKMSMAANYYEIRRLVGYDDTDAMVYTLSRKATFKTPNDIDLASEVVTKVRDYPKGQPLTAAKYIELGCKAVM